MKIGYLMQAGVPDIIKEPLSGPSVHVIQVINKLQNFGHSVRLVFQINNQIWISDDLVNYTIVQISWLDKGPIRWCERLCRGIQSRLRLPYVGFFESLRFLIACWKVLAGFNLFYERMGWFGYAGALASRSMGVPLILEVNGDHLSELQIRNQAPHGIQKWLSVYLLKWATNHASHIVATGNGWRQKFLDQWNVPPTKISVIENGTSLVDILTQNQLQSFNENQENCESITLVFIGGFEAWQGIPILLRAFYRVVSDGLIANLVIIGSGPEKPDLAKLVSELNIHQSITFAGKMSVLEYAPLLAKADIGISPYCGRAEFSGLKLLDYKAAGLAIIASGQDGQPDLLVHMGTAVIVRPCDEGALYEAIIMLYNDTMLRKRLGRAARIEAEKIHSWQQTAKQLESIFYSVVKRKMD